MDQQQGQENTEEKTAVEEKTAMEEIREGLASVYNYFENWIRPSRSQPLVLQILMFILKIPVLLLLLMFSPVVLVILLIMFFAAL